MDISRGRCNKFPQVTYDVRNLISSSHSSVSHKAFQDFVFVESAAPISDDSLANEPEDSEVGPPSLEEYSIGTRSLSEEP